MFSLLLLFSIYIRAGLRKAGNPLKGMGVALVSVIPASLVGILVFRDQVDRIWQVAGISGAGAGLRVRAVRFYLV